MRKTKEANALYMRNLRNKYKKLGLCDLCGQEVLPGYAHCAIHLEYFKNYKQKYRKQSDKERCNSLERRNKLAADGKCVWCQQPITATKRGGKVCQNCRKKALDSKKTLWQERLCSGLCKYCGICKVTDVKSDYCEICRCKRIARNNLHNAKMWVELKELFDKQNICPYTGIKLILGVNATLDHIVPKSKGGSDNMENLQWVYGGCDFDINTMKGKSSNEEFLSAIKVLYKFNYSKRE